MHTRMYWAQRVSCYLSCYWTFRTRLKRMCKSNDITNSMKQRRSWVSHCLSSSDEIPRLSEPIHKLWLLDTTFHLDLIALIALGTEYISEAIGFVVATEVVVRLISILKMEVICFSETSVHIRTPRRYIPKDGNVHIWSSSLCKYKYYLHYVFKHYQCKSILYHHHHHHQCIFSSLLYLGRLFQFFGPIHSR
jgi:hypothetical protein